MLLLLTRPRYDIPTHYLFYWAEFFISESKKRSVDIIDLEKNKVNKNKFHSYLVKRPIDIVILNGHGNSMEVAGHDNEVILSIGDGHNLFRDRVIFIRACDAGSLLGPEIMKEGAVGFIGYNQPFMFPIDKDFLNKPLKDDLAKPILECSNQVGISLIKGKNVNEAQEESISMYIDKINEYSSSNASNSFILPFLLWNMNSQVCYSR